MIKTIIIEDEIPARNKLKRFPINTHKGFYFIEAENITFFTACEGVIFAYDNTGKKHLLTENTLKEIEKQINPDDFFRINRSELVNKKHIEKIERYSKNSLSLKIRGYEKHLVTSQSNTPAFRKWLEN